MSLHDKQKEAIATAPVVPSRTGSYAGEPSMYERGFEDGLREMLKFFSDDLAHTPEEIHKVAALYAAWRVKRLQNLKG